MENGSFSIDTYFCGSEVDACKTDNSEGLKRDDCVEHYLLNKRETAAKGPTSDTNESKYYEQAEYPGTATNECEGNNRECQIGEESLIQNVKSDYKYEISHTHGGQSAGTTTGQRVLDGVGNGKNRKRFKGTQVFVCNNDKMHCRNKHKEFVDYKMLSDKYEELKPYVFRNKFNGYSIKYKDTNALSVLTKCLMKYHYNIHWELPENSPYLIPTLPSRANYVHSVADLFGTNDISIPRGRHVCGIDIGCGANCIYPLLGHAEYGWSFIGTDIDRDALDHAEILVNKNDLNEYITFRHQSDSRSIFQNIFGASERCAFVVCNPPFHDDLHSAFVNPARTLIANDNEVVCEGGEFAFIDRMIDESSQFPLLAIWFTTLVAKLQNVKTLCRKLQQKGSVDGDKCNLQIKGFRKFTLYQGKQTRWVISWTWMDDAEREAAIASLTSAHCKKVKLN